MKWQIMNRFQLFKCLQEHIDILLQTIISEFSIKAPKDRHDYVLHTCQDEGAPISPKVQIQTQPNVEGSTSNTRLEY